MRLQRPQILRQDVEFERAEIGIPGLGPSAHLAGTLLIAAIQVSHAGVNGMTGFSEGLGGELANAGSGAGNEDN